MRCPGKLMKLRSKLELEGKKIITSGKKCKLDAGLTKSQGQAQLRTSIYAVLWFPGTVAGHVAC